MAKCVNEVNCRFYEAPDVCYNSVVAKSWLGMGRRKCCVVKGKICRDAVARTVTKDPQHRGKKVAGWKPSGKQKPKPKPRTAAMSEMSHRQRVEVAYGKKKAYTDFTTPHFDFEPMELKIQAPDSSALREEWQFRGYWLSEAMKRETVDWTVKLNLREQEVLMKLMGATYPIYMKDLSQDKWVSCFLARFRGLQDEGHDKIYEMTWVLDSPYARMNREMKMRESRGY